MTTPVVKLTWEFPSNDLCGARRVLVYSSDLPSQGFSSKVGDPLSVATHLSLEEHPDPLE